MRVICIDDKIAMGIKEGNIYTASQCTHYNDCYFLEEQHICPCGCGRSISYGKIRFIPLSSIDETEFERNYQKELV